MSYEKLYEYAFNYSLLPMIEDSSEALLESTPSYLNSFNPIIRIASDDYYTHTAIVSVNTYRVLTTMASLLAKMLQTHGIECTLYASGIGDSVKAFSFNNQNKSTCVYLCFFPLDDAREIINSQRERNCFDEIIIVTLTDPKDENAFMILKATPQQECESFDSTIRIITLKEFFEQNFSKDEYSAFLEHVAHFNEHSQNVIGLNTTVIPTEKSIEKFREKVIKEIAEKDYSKLRNKMGYELFTIVHNNYINNKRYMAMGSKLVFAGSFLSSEWNYRIHQITESLDQTGIVAGYLKSVEQLLYELISFSKDQPNRKIAHYKNGKHYLSSFTSANEAYVNSALNKLENFIKYNADLINNNKAKNYILDSLEDWRKKYRNGFFHKDNLNNNTVVKEIRSQAISLYFLILGSWQLNENELEHLGIVEPTGYIKVDEDKIFDSISKQLILKTNWLSKDVDELSFWLKERSFDPWIKETNTGWVLSYSFVEDNIHSNSHLQRNLETNKGDYGKQSLEWNSADDWRATFDMIEMILKRCLKECLDKDKCTIKTAYLYYDNIFTGESRKVILL